MNKTDIIKKVQAETGLPLKDSAAAVNATFAIMADALAKGEPRVSISGFGSFVANTVPAKKMVSPLNNGGVISVGKTSKVRFRASDILKEQVTKKNKAPSIKKKK